MKEAKERSLQDQTWVEQKKINREINLALYPDIGFRSLISARRVFRKRRSNQEVMQKYVR